MNSIIFVWGILACTYRFGVSSIPKVWPIPQKVVYSDQGCTISSSFEFEYDGNASSTIFDGVLQRAVSRANTDVRNLLRFGRPESHGCQINRCVVTPEDSDSSWEETVESERYAVRIDGPDCVISCKFSRGCLPGLTTFVQLVDPLVDFSVPSKVEIEDFPEFVYRGVMIDTGRRFLPVRLIKRHIDLMSSVKMNVLHWHLVDDHSFPLEFASLPLLSQKGAYSSSAIYTAQDVGDIVQYAADRGIRVVPEIDVPGHTESWLKGYPELLGIAKAAIDPTRPENWIFLDSLISELAQIFSCPYFSGKLKIHLGGDETWDGWDTPAMRTWMADQGMTQKGDLAQFWLQKLLAIAKSVDVILWEDFLADIPDVDIVIDSSLVWEIWMRKWPTAFPRPFIFASDFYLDHLDKDWSDFYNVEMHADSLALGGEACMWGEWVDEANFISRVWPRAAAVAERLWSNPASDATFATSRLAKWTCRQRHWFGFPDVGSVGRVRAENPDELWTWHTDKEQWYCAEAVDMHWKTRTLVVYE